MMSYAQSWSPAAKATAELELRRRKEQALQRLRALDPAEFAGRTKITVPAGSDSAIVPFALWPAQIETLATMEHEDLVLILKARQLGISWLVCLFVLRLCLFKPAQQVLFLSKDQLAANKLIQRTRFLYHQHADKDLFPALTKDATQELVWSNDSSVISLPATRGAGRSETASIVVLDEWAFMPWPGETLAAVKPTIDAGGKLFIISSADGPGSAYHQLWQGAISGSNGYTPVFIPWFARPDRAAGWRNQKLQESGGDTATISREYPANDLEAFVNAAGLIYDCWSDGPDDGNVTEAADYATGAGPVLWAVDDGYSGKLDAATGYYPAQSHPRVFLLVQQRPNGQLCVFDEHYACGLLSDQHIAQVQALPYPAPDYAVVDKSAAELRGRLHADGIPTQKGPADVKESTKEMRRALAPDINGVRRVLVHPRCRHLRNELASYRADATGTPIKAFDHGPDGLRYLVWRMRYEQ